MVPWVMQNAAGSSEAGMPEIILVGQQRLNFNIPNKSSDEFAGREIPPFHPAINIRN
jgi:hypothetical protein